MPLQPWYKSATPRQEVREGRSFNPDEFVIHLEQVVAGTAPDDYRDPVKFFARTSFTRALREHAKMVLRRLAGHTNNTAPVLTLVTQFGGGKTHTLAALYHLATAGNAVARSADVAELLKNAGLKEAPQARVATFVGNAWDPQPGRETPWMDLAYQIAGDAGAKLLGKAAKTAPPGTEALGRLFAAADAPVLVLFDEVLNCINRHKELPEPFYAFIQNLTGALTATKRCAAVISLPRSQVEVPSDKDLQWQERVTKVVKRVSKDLIANDEAEISEVVRRRLFDCLGDHKVRRQVANKYADWCFKHRHALPPEWTTMAGAESNGKERKAREQLRARFCACYPFHPATLSVFQRKWQALSQFQQTRGTLAMLGQWISWAYKDAFKQAHAEALITIGSAPLDVLEFRSAVLGQLGEAKLQAAIGADIAGDAAHAKALDADTKSELRGIHRRVGTAILFESSGGQVDKTAHLPELRFALGGPGVDTASIDNAAAKLEQRAYFVRKVGADGYKVSHRPTLRKVVYDRRAALDYEREIQPALHKVVQKQFDKKAAMPRVYFPAASQDIPDSPKLMLVVAEPEAEWDGDLREKISAWTKQRGNSPRLYPGALVWTAKKSGRALHAKVEMWLAWKRVALEVQEGTLGDEFEAEDRGALQRQIREAEQAAEEGVWGDYRYIALYDAAGDKGIKEIDLGAGHSSAADALSGRVLDALKAQALLNETIGAGYLERNWPQAFKETGAWPLSGLRQSFLNGALTRLADPDTALRRKITEFVRNGEFALASGAQKDGGYARFWYKQEIDPGDVAFEADVFLLQKKRAQELMERPEAKAEAEAESTTEFAEKAGGESGGSAAGSAAKASPEVSPLTKQRLCIEGAVPPELWNRLGTSLLTKLRGNNTEGLHTEFHFRFTVGAADAQHLRAQLQQALADLELAQTVTIREQAGEQ